MGKVTWHGWSTSYDQIPESSSITFVKDGAAEDKVAKDKKFKKEAKDTKETKTKK